MKYLIVDDVRSVEMALLIAEDRTGRACPSSSEITLVRTYQEGLEQLCSDTFWDVVLMDHDLGSADVNDDGTRLMNKYEEYIHDKPLNIGRFVVISSNPRGSENMERTFSAIKRRHE